MWNSASLSRRVLGAAAAFVCGLAFILGTPPPAVAQGLERGQGSEIQLARLGGACRAIPFESANLEDGGRRGWYLVISGLRRFANMDVSLTHRRRGRGVWTVEVVGCTQNFIVIPLQTPYVIWLPLRNLPGARRVKVIGAGGHVWRTVPR